MTDIVRKPGLAVQRPSSTELEQFEAVLTTVMDALGLPSEAVFIEFRQRQMVLTNFEGAIDRLDDDHRARAMYLSKFMVAVGAGLFDAALNYLWDETISELRRRVAGYDLSYFFDIAVQAPDRRKQLKTEEDLVRVDDYDLIRAANEIGLVPDVGFRQLDLIRYMRNFASAAHPNQNELGGNAVARLGGDLHQGGHYSSRVECGRRDKAALGEYQDKKAHVAEGQRGCELLRWSCSG